MTKPQNKFCVVSLILRWGQLKATDVHHQRGRANALLLDERFWLPVSRRGHDWINRNPAAAKLLGLVAGPWNHQPGPSIPSVNLETIICEGRALRDSNPEWSRS